MVVQGSSILAVSVHQLFTSTVLVVDNKHHSVVGIGDSYRGGNLTHSLKLTSNSA